MVNKKHFKDPIRPKERKQHFPFQGPTKEQATTGRFFEAGDNYGTGFHNPVGSKKPKTIHDGPIPLSSKCFPCDEAI